MRVGSLAGLFVLGLAGVVHAQDIEVALEPVKLDEGKRASLLVRVKNTGTHPVAVASIELALGSMRRTATLTAEVRGASVASDSVVVAAFAVGPRLTKASGHPEPEEPGFRVVIGSEAFTELRRVLAPGESTLTQIDVLPLACRDRTLTVDVESIPLERLRSDAGLFQMGEKRVPTLLGEKNQDGGTPGMGLAKDRLATVAVQEWIAVPPGATPTEVLVPERVARAAARETTTRSIELDVAAAAFPASEALARVEVVLVRAGYSRTQALWGFDGAEGSWLVGREGKPLRHTGTLAALALDLDVSSGGARVHGHIPGALEAAIVAAGIAPGSGADKAGIHITVQAKEIPAFLAVLEKNAFMLDGLEIVKEKKGGAPVAQPEQGTRIPCLECQVLRPGLEGCAACGGKGFVFKAARMGDTTAKLHFGSAARKRADGAFERARDGGPWSDAASELRSALTESLLYGKAWAAGWDGRAEVPKEDAIAQALEASVRAQLRLSVLEAEAKGR